jgi:hypothetical protein
LLAGRKERSDLLVGGDIDRYHLPVIGPYVAVTGRRRVGNTVVDGDRTPNVLKIGVSSDYNRPTWKRCPGRKVERVQFAIAASYEHSVVCRVQGRRTGHSKDLVRYIRALGLLRSKIPVPDLRSGNRVNCVEIAVFGSHIHKVELGSIDDNAGREDRLHNRHCAQIEVPELVKTSDC